MLLRADGQLIKFRQVSRCTRHGHHLAPECPGCAIEAKAARRAEALARRNSSKLSNSSRELTEADRDLRQAINYADGINAVVEGFLRIHNAAVDLKRAFAVSDIEVQP